MALHMRQELRMSQQLVMTPQLQQAIKLLQLSRPELVDLVRNELLENPMLEEGRELGNSTEEPSSTVELQESVELQDKLSSDGSDQTKVERSEHQGSGGQFNFSLDFKY